MKPSLEFLKKEFFKYYYENINRIIPPSPIKNREFGFFLDKEKGMFRHKCFHSLEDFHRFVLNEIPLDIYVSAARYEDPSNRDMSEKKLINAEFFFDIDAKPSIISSEKEAVWICRKCGKYDLGIEEKCPFCGSKTETVELVNEEKLKGALGETEKLISVLMNDFGIDKEHVSVFFSGNRGYHVHVDQEEFLNIGSEGRREIVDYLLIQGLNEKEILRFLNKGFKTEDLKGIRGRVYNRVLETMRSETRRGKKMALNMLSRAIEELRVKIDPVVTIDMHRLMRMPSSINSNSGMVKKNIPLSDLHSFNPLKEALAFDDEETILRVKAAPKFELGGRTFGPFKDEEVELPIYAAIYLVCKGLGENVEG